MMEYKINLLLDFACVALLLFCRDSLADGLEAAVISREARDRAKDATVSIYAKDYSWEKYVFRGSGFFVAPHVIATNFHVIEDKDRSKIKSMLAYKHSKKKRFRPIKHVHAVDRTHDLAILQVSASSVKPLHIGDSRAVESLDRVFIVGNPLGYEGKFSQGVISGEEEIQGVNYIQTDAAISPGSSGGPLMNIQGEVIGIATRAHMFIGQNLNFAIPSNRLKALLKRHGIRLPPKPKTRISNQLQAATVLIFGRDRNGNEGLLGSGFFVHKDQVATDFHVVDGSILREVKRFGHGTKPADTRFSAQLLKTDKAHHLAILQVKGADVQPLRLANSEAVGIDEIISVVGDPSSGEFSEGKISQILDEEGVRYFEFDAPVSPGSSGGPIVNARGEVIAVTALKVVAISGTLKNAIPSNYLKELLAGKGDTPLPPPPLPKHEVSSESASLTEPSPYGEWLKSGIDRYEQAKYEDAIRLLESALDGLTHPKNRAKAHLYLGCSRRGRGDFQESVIAEFREALSFDPDVELPPNVGQNHPIFKPLLEKTREDATGTLTVNASPPETQIWIYGGESKQEHPYVGTVVLRLFKGDYTVKCSLEESTLREANTNVKTIRIEPGVHYILDRELTRMPSTSRELTLELDRMVKPQQVEVHYEIYGPTGVELDRGVKLMQLQGEKPDLGTWVYSAKWPPSTPAGRLVYRIKVDGKDILPIPPPEIVILEPPTDAWVYINQAFDLKAMVTSDIQLTEVLVHYSDASKKLRKMDTPDTYIGTVTARDKRKAGTIWYFVTAKNQEGKISRSEVRLVEIRRPDDDTDTDSVPPPEITVLAPRGSAVLPINKAINIEAEVESNAPLKEVRVFYNSERKQLSETSPSSMLENKSSDTYIGKIPKEHNREEGHIWFFVMATTEKGVPSQTEDSVIEVKKLPTWRQEGVWASHSWSSYVQNDLLLNSDWARGDVVSLSFLSEGKGFQTIGARLDFPYENSANTNAAIQWGPALKDSHIAFAILAGVAGYRSSDASFSRTRQSTEITPILGGSLKFYPLDRATIDLTGSIKLRSENSDADRNSSFTKEYLHHYEMGIRLYISPTLNLRAGYGEWRIGEYNNTSVQIGLGSTF